MNSISTMSKISPIYTAQAIQQWEKRWFLQGNSSFGLMQQASLYMANHIEQIVLNSSYFSTSCSIVVCCGVGNNGGDGYLIAQYLAEKNFNVSIFTPFPAKSEDCQRARQSAIKHNITIISQLNSTFDVYIDALFGNGLNQNLSDDYQAIIRYLNQQHGLKIAIDIPSGLHPDMAYPLPIAFKADITLCVMGLKMGLITGQGRYFSGNIIEIPLIPPDEMLEAYAYWNKSQPKLKQRREYAHKGDFGHVLIIGGHANMGGAVIMAGESAMSCGAGKVTVMCHQHHHQAIVSRSPNLMVKDIVDIHTDDFNQYLKQIDVVAFGMGLGRDEWSQNIYQTVMPILHQHTHLDIILDADALYFLAQQPQQFNQRYILTPHSAEAGRLLNKTIDEIEQNRVQAIYQLQQKYQGNWVLKGAGSLSLEQTTSPSIAKIFVCGFGNAGMATAGMGDVLSGMLASLRCQKQPLADCVNLHALAGDRLAQKGQHGLQAHTMLQAIYNIINEIENK